MENDSYGALEALVLTLISPKCIEKALKDIEQEVDLMRFVFSFFG
jgi:hypothetical protein